MLTLFYRHVMQIGEVSHVSYNQKKIATFLYSCICPISSLNDVQFDIVINKGSQLIDVKSRRDWKPQNCYMYCLLSRGTFEQHLDLSLARMRYMWCANVQWDRIDNKRLVKENQFFKASKVDFFQFHQTHYILIINTI